MTHIILDIKYVKTEPVLYDNNRGESIIRDWCEYNKHMLVMSPVTHIFPSFNQTNFTTIIEDFYPQSTNTSSQNKNYNGYTTIGMLKESHISIHTYPELNSMQVDFFSCKTLNIPQNIEYIERIFKKSNAIKFNYKCIERPVS